MYPGLLQISIKTNLHLSRKDTTKNKILLWTKYLIKHRLYLDSTISLENFVQGQTYTIQKIYDSLVLVGLLF